MPVSAIFENLEAGASIDNILSHFAFEIQEASERARAHS
jgi:uncharacterized protein (DUF433 family)